jgi:hypothetical protein
MEHVKRALVAADLKLERLARLGVGHRNRDVPVVRVPEERMWIPSLTRRSSSRGATAMRASSGSGEVVRIMVAPV